MKKTVKTDKGWVDLSNLVYNGKFVDWDMSIGKTVDFQYNDIISTLTITGRTNDVQYVYIDIPNYINHHKIHVGQIKHGQLGGALNLHTSNFRYKIADVVNGLLITGMRKISNHKYYDYRCTKDGYEGYIRESHLMSEHGCPVCAGKHVLQGCNDIATTRPDMVDLFYNKNDSFIYTEHSNKYTDFICPRCGNKIHAMINCVASYGLSCKKCSDGISYPNKFIYNLIDQISKLYASKEKRFTFQPEKKFDWAMNFWHENKNLSGKKIYDLYINEFNIIIENHGDYHYKESLFNIKGVKSFEEVVENDKIKKNLAIINGIKEDHYVVLDCCKSTMDYIKNSVMSSNLPNLLNFTESDIDWCECDKFATSSRVYEVCEMWNGGALTKQDIANETKMHKYTISKYIKRGVELGIVTR